MACDCNLIADTIHTHTHTHTHTPVLNDDTVGLKHSAWGQLVQLASTGSGLLWSSILVD